MKKLLGYVSIRVSPPGAAVTVDGEAQQPEALTKPIPLAPGSHTVGASMPGYVAAQQRVAVASGEQPQSVTLTLAQLGAGVRSASELPGTGGVIGPAPGTPIPKRKTGLLVTGIALTSFGVVNVAVGAAFLASSQCIAGCAVGSRDLGPQRAAGAIAMVTGGVLLAAGLPLV